MLGELQEGTLIFKLPMTESEQYIFDSAFNGEPIELLGRLISIRHVIQQHNTNTSPLVKLDYVIG